MGTVYRIQNENGKGPYRGLYNMPIELYDILNEHHRPIHPKPMDDGYDYMLEENMLCGFESMDSLHKWFSKYELKLLRQSGFEIYTLDNIEIVAILSRQVIFTKRHYTTPPNAPVRLVKAVAFDSRQGIEF